MQDGSALNPARPQPSHQNFSQSSASSCLFPQRCWRVCWPAQLKSTIYVTPQSINPEAMASQRTPEVLIHILGGPRSGQTTLVRRVSLAASSRTVSHSIGTLISVLHTHILRECFFSPVADAEFPKCLVPIQCLRRHLRCHLHGRPE